MQKIERNALAQSQVAGGCAKGSRATATNTTTVVIRFA